MAALAEIDHLWKKISSRTGYVTSKEDALNLVKTYSAATNMRYMKDKWPGVFGKGVEPKKLTTLLYEWKEAIPYDGTPFVMVATATFCCVFGRDQHAKLKRVRAQKREAELKSGDPPTKKYKQPYASTKKGCPAKFAIREVLKFSQFKLEKNTEGLRRRLVLHLKHTEAGNEFQRRFYVTLPEAEDHRFHTVPMEVTLNKLEETNRTSPFINPGIGDVEIASETPTYATEVEIEDTELHTSIAEHSIYNTSTKLISATSTIARPCCDAVSAQDDPTRIKPLRATSDYAMEVVMEDTEPASLIEAKQCCDIVRIQDDPTRIKPLRKIAALCHENLDTIKSQTYLFKTTPGSRKALVEACQTLIDVRQRLDCALRQQNGLVMTTSVKDHDYLGENWTSF